MQRTLAEIAQIVNGKVVGNGNVSITGLNGIKEARQGDLTFVANAKYASLIHTTKASAIIVPKDIEVTSHPVIQVDNPSLAFAKAAALIADRQTIFPEGVHPTAIIGQNVSLGKSVGIGAYVVIEDGASIGDHVVLHHGCFVGHGTSIGCRSVIYPNVTIRERVSIGQNVIVHSGAVIGCDGFGFEQVDGAHVKIPQIGTVLIEDDVEIGANVTIDRARFDKTIIGQGTKIDNLVQIAHNVVIGKNCIIIALVGISGSVKIEDGVILAGQSGVSGHLTIGAGTIVAAKTGVTKSLPPHSVVSGMPARDRQETNRANAAFFKLPDYIKTIQELKERVAELEAKINKKA